jgi:hypothetical protein
LAYSKLSENASIIIPIGDTRVTEYLSQYININGQNAYQSSSILALAIDAVEGYQHLIPPQTVYIYIYICIHVYIYVYIYIYIYMCVQICVYICLSLNILYICVYMIGTNRT